VLGLQLLELRLGIGIADLNQIADMKLSRANSDRRSEPGVMKHRTGRTVHTGPPQ